MIYFSVAFLLPPAAAIILFLFAWREGWLSQPLLLGGLALIGVVGEILAPVYSMPWLASALLNVGVAMYLAIRLKLS